MIGRGWRVLAIAPDIDAETGAQLAALGAETAVTSLARTGMNPLRELGYCRELFGLFCKERPDVVLAYTIKPVIWGLLAARFAGVRRALGMITGLGYAFTEGVGGGAKRVLAAGVASLLYRLALRRADGVMFQNTDDRDLFLKRGLLRDRGQIAVIDGSGVDLDYYSPTPLPDEPVFLMIGRLLGAKGVREYAAAATALRGRHPHARFMLAGWRDPGPDAITEAELEAWIEAGLEYLGRLYDVRSAISGARVYVLPSYREGTPRSVLEAMAMGRPIITTDAPGCRETVIEGVNGLLVEPQNASALERAMERLIENPEMAAPMGRASLDLARRRYDVNRVNSQILSIVQGV